MNQENSAAAQGEDHESYSDRELKARRSAQDEIRKQSFRKLMVGVAVGVTLVAAAAEFVKFETGRMDHQAQATRAHEIIPPVNAASTGDGTAPQPN